MQTGCRRGVVGERRPVALTGIGGGMGAGGGDLLPSRVQRWGGFWEQTCPSSFCHIIGFSHLVLEAEVKMELGMG